ncbi:MAG: carbohydrate-binding protein [Bacteroidales bacterium]|nr:carbohydrate-binding protein [Bacteroidales bacterium]
MPRSIWTSGYQSAIDNASGHSEDVSGASIAEWSSHQNKSLFAYPATMLNLPVKQTPEPVWDDLSQWEKVNNTEDDAAEFQRAIDAGKTTVYVPRGNYSIKGPVYVRGNVKRIIGCEATIYLDESDTTSGFVVEDGTYPTVIMERFDAGYPKGVWMVKHAARELVVKSCANWNVKKLQGSGDLYLEDVVPTPDQWFEFHGGNVWARQFNIESKVNTNVLNNGANFWALGIKTEASRTLVHTINGGKSEVLGFFCYTTIVPAKGPLFVVNESALSAQGGEACYYSEPGFQNFVVQTKDGVTDTLKATSLPARSGTGRSLPRYTGGEAVSEPEVTVGAEYVPVVGVSLNKEQATIDRGPYLKLAATIDPVDASNKYVTWHSLNTNIATVNASRLVTGINAGSTAIVVTTKDKEKTDTCWLTVNDSDVKPTGVYIKPSSLYLYVNETGLLKAIVVPDYATYKAVKWNSADVSVATINADGLVTAVAPGKTQVFAVTDTGNVQGHCDVVIELLQEPSEFKIEAESFQNAGSGGDTDPPYKGTTDIGGIDNKDWVVYEDVDFDAAVYSSLVITAATNQPGGSIEMHIDSARGPVVSTVEIDESTGGWTTFREFEGDIVVNITGTRDVYLVGKGGAGGIANLDYFKLISKGTEPTQRIEAEKLQYERRAYTSF